MRGDSMSRPSIQRTQKVPKHEKFTCPSGCGEKRKDSLLARSNTDAQHRWTKKLPFHIWMNTWWCAMSQATHEATKCAVNKRKTTMFARTSKLSSKKLRPIVRHLLLFFHALLNYRHNQRKGLSPWNTTITCRRSFCSSASCRVFEIPKPVWVVQYDWS